MLHCRFANATQVSLCEVDRWKVKTMKNKPDNTHIPHRELGNLAHTKKGTSLQISTIRVNLVARESISIVFLKMVKVWKHMIFCEYCNEHVRVGSADLTTICMGDLERPMNLISFSNETFKQEQVKHSSQWWLNGRTEKGEGQGELPVIIWQLTKTADESIRIVAYHAYTLIESIDQYEILQIWDYPHQRVI